MVGIVTAVFGCDNVSFGGMSLTLEGPQEDSLAAQPEGASSQGGSGPERIDYGPLLYAGIRQGDSALVVPVAEFVEGRLQPLPDGVPGTQLATQIMEERMVPGRKLILFHQGARVGTFTVSTSSEDAGRYCSPRPQAVGPMELSPSASAAERFLALEEEMGRREPYGQFRGFSAERQHRIAIQNLAGEALNELRAQWPAASLQDTRQDLQVFQTAPEEAPSIVGTFLIQDQLAIAPAPDPAYSLLIIGSQRGAQFSREYTWYRRVGDSGKGAPRFFSKMDWDGDGDEELLLEVFGAEARWWAALERVGGSWSLVFQEPCGAPLAS
ncbi:MAG: hypothetical protein PVJ76_04275 [Gemmatimonadota bacterium]